MNSASLIVLCAVLLTGCSAAVRTESFRIQASPGWSTAGKWESYQCADSNLSVQRFRFSRLIIMGPVVPLIPLPGGNSGAFRVWVNGPDSCPEIVQKDHRIRAIDLGPVEQMCRYDVGRLDLTLPLVLELGDGSAGCSSEPVQYNEKVDWKYCLMCTA